MKREEFAKDQSRYIVGICGCSERTKLRTVIEQMSVGKWSHWNTGGDVVRSLGLF